MPILHVGEAMPNFLFDTPYKTQQSWVEAAAQATGKTALLFLRYYGCTLCQYDLHQLAAHYNQISASGSQLFVVLQSTQDSIHAQMDKGSFPFSIICDPEKKLYQQFEIHSARTQGDMLSPSTLLKVAKATLNGHHHGTYEGDELQLPATFIVDNNLTITYAHYGTAAGDVPSASRLAELLAAPV